MAWDRPSCTAAVVACLLMLSVNVGCRSGQSTAIPSPFMADRVPAPASRIPAAGSAQPYYPGDALPPLPASQPAVQPLGTLVPSSDIAPLASATPPKSEPRIASDTQIGGDSLVRIPEDNLSLRFAVRPEPENLPTVAATTNSLNPTSQPAAPLDINSPAASNTLAVANTTPTAFRDQHSVQPTAPVISNWPPVEAPLAQATLTPAVNSQPASGLFREPAVPAQAPPLIRGAVSQPAVSPRVRMPGADQMIREPVVPGSINTTSYQVGMAGGGANQTMLIPPPGYVPEAFTPAPSTAPLSAADGFRARGSSRTRFGDETSGRAIPSIRVTPR